MKTENLRRYFYPLVGGILLMISPYVILYEENTVIGVAFALLGVSLIGDELVRRREKADGDSGTETTE